MAAELRNGTAVQGCAMRRCLILLVCLAASTSLAADKRGITEKDLFDFVWIGDPQISPDGSRVAFVRVTVNEKKTGYDTSIWTVGTAGNEEPHRLTNGNHDNSPRWSPDGKFLAFVRSVEKDGKPEPGQLALLPMNGGDAWSVTDLPKGASGPRWSPDGKTIAFSSSSNPDDLAKQAKKKQKEDDAKKASPSPAPSGSPAKSDGDEERESDVVVVTRAVYREDNEGNLDFKRPDHIWTIQAPRTAEEKVQPKQLTSGRFDEGQLVWSNDGAQILFASLHVDEPYYELPRTEIYSITARGGEPTKLTTIAAGAQGLALSPDGKQLAFIASVNEPVNSYT